MFKLVQTLSVSLWLLLGHWFSPVALATQPMTLNTVVTTMTYHSYADGREVLSRNTASYIDNNNSPQAMESDTVVIDSDTQQHLSESDARGDQTLYYYDSLQHLTRKRYLEKRRAGTLADNSEWFTDTLTSNGEQRSVTAANGNITTTFFNALGQIIETDFQIDRHAQPRVKSLTQYNDQGQPQTITNEWQQTTQYTYDANGRNTEIIHPSIDGNSAHRTAEVIRYNDVTHQQRTQLVLANTGRALSGSTIKTFNNAAQMTNTAILAGKRTGLAPIFPARNRQLSSQTRYDNFSQTTEDKQQTSAMGNSSTSSQTIDKLTYDALGQVKHATLPIQQHPTKNLPQYAETVDFDYDLNQNLRKKTLHYRGQSSNRYLLTYSGNQQLLTQYRFTHDDDIASSIKQTYAYNLEGDNVSMLDWAQHQFSYQYQRYLGQEQLIDTTIPAVGNKPAYHIEREYNDPKHPGQLSAIYYQDAQHTWGRINYRYTADGQLKTVTYPDNKTIHYQYDNHDVLQTITDGENTTTQYHYDNAHNIIEADLSKDGKIIAQQSAIYNLQNQLLTRLNYHNGQLINDTYYSYDGFGNPDRIGYLDDNGLDKDTIGYQYDRNGNVVQENTIHQQGNHYSHHCQQFSYDNLDHLQTSTDHSYSDDGVENNTQQRVYVYGSTGNLRDTLVFNQQTSQTELQISTPPVDDYTYNTLDQLKTIKGQQAAIHYNASGNLTQDDANNQYTFDAQNNLIRFISADKKTTRFTYYPDGTRRTKTLANGITLTYHYSGSDLIDTVSNKNNSASYLLLDGQHQVRVTDISGVTNVDFLTHNAHHSITSSVNVNDQQQQKTTFSRYNDYGNPIESTTSYDANNPLATNPFRYSEQQWDPQTHLYYAKARYYCPRLHSFISADSYLLMNRYAYCAGNPKRFFDPTGHVLTLLNFFQVVTTDVAPEARAAESITREIAKPAAERIEMTAEEFFSKSVIETDKENIPPANITRERESRALNPAKRRRTAFTETKDKWKVPERFQKNTNWGNRRRAFWKWEAKEGKWAEYSGEKNAVGLWGKENILRMREGLAPTYFDKYTQEKVSVELSHDTPGKAGPFRPVSRRKHAEFDAQRYKRLSKYEKTLVNSGAIVKLCPEVLIQSEII